MSENTQTEQNFKDLPFEEKWKAIEKVIDESIRQFLVMDGGNMEIIDMKENGDFIDVYIRYMGACVGCASATTGTLFGIEHTLRQKLGYENIRVLPI
ncbi:NifU-like protein [Nitratiruptor sp. YY09-18]|nr:NifU family protein [Nitratiruptor sp. YY09-18]BCD67309.1 NifU-like protein [Nitratiruptor sp. YY09-18]